MKNLICNVLRAAGVIEVDDTNYNNNNNNEEKDYNEVVRDEETIAIQRMEEWLGLYCDPTKTVDTITTVEDCIPFSKEFYTELGTLFEAGWNPKKFALLSTALSSSSSTSNDLVWTRTNTNRLIDSHQLLVPTEISLEKVYCSIRITKWFSTLLEYDFDDDDDDNNNENDNCPAQDGGSSLSRKLFKISTAASVSNTIETNTDDVIIKNDTDDDDPNDHTTGSTNNQQQQSQESLSNTTSFKALPLAMKLIQAFFEHIEQLPTIQGHINNYVVYLQQAKYNTNDGTTTRLIDPTKRLQQYELAQQVAQKLQKEWTDHMNQLESILTDWYITSNAQQRQYIRKYLGIYWSKYVLNIQSAAVGTSHGGGGIASTGSSSAIKQENTIAAGMKMTLRILHKILLGIEQCSTNDNDIADPNNNNNNQQQKDVLEHLLMNQLIPLHKADGFVLWRDQTAMLELYHEPLTQCIAIILQHYPSWILRTIALLVHPTIFPVAGNTPKQILLLHEIDTYISLLPTGLIDSTDVTYDNNANSTENNVRSLLTVLGRCMSSEHSRVAERALQFIKNNKFVNLVLQQEKYLASTLRLLLPSLVRSEPSWNPTVRKMTYNVLIKLIHNATTTDKKSSPDTEPTPDDESAKYDRIVRQICNELFGHQVSRFGDNIDQTIQQQEQQLPPPPIVKKGILHEDNIDEDDTEGTTVTSMSQFSLKAGMGSWRPPSSASHTSPQDSSSSHTSRNQFHSSMPPPARPSRLQLPPGKGVAPWAKATDSSNNQPPLTITGVAPWATKGSSTTPGSGTKQQQQPSSTITGVAPWATIKTTPPNRPLQQQPPVTITGIAPWAIKKQSVPTPSSSLLSEGPGAIGGQKRYRPPQDLATVPAADKDENEDEDENEKDDQDLEGTDSNDDEHDSDITDSPSSPRSGYDYVLAYIRRIKPPEEEGGLSSWSRAQMADTPTFLPELKFHDLVFGHDLGSGAFGKVRYARVIDKTKSRSYWAEYAIKIVSTEKIKEMGYEASIQREIACLLVLSHHPGIARLVSTFRFREGAYLVLEYASQGDLHTLIHKHGSLDTDSTRFVIGEVIAAITSIHDMGFLYGDLKPENIVITETGHIKLTDFGGCRPLTDEAKDLVRDVGRGILKNLRDGDWKPKAKKHSESMNVDEDSEFQEYYEDAEDDYRVEGTTAYLPPEVVMGAFPTFSSDSWALGCVMYQCLSGRPPLLDIDDEATKKRIVSFDIDNNTNDSTEHHLFLGKHAAGIENQARSMIIALLNRDPSQRPGMRQIADHEFFIMSDVNVFSLHSKPAFPLDVGTVTASADNAQWSRRQFSSIWAPQPVAYDISLNASMNSGTVRKSSSFNSASNNNTPIEQGDERCGYFAASGKGIKSSFSKSGIKSEQRRMLMPPST